jgi:hypothetical protein
VGAELAELETLYRERFRAFAAPTCWWLQIRRGVYGGGCARDDRDTSSIWEVASVRLRVRNHELWVLRGRAGSRFASLALRFQGGRSQPLARRQGFSST